VPDAVFQVTPSGSDRLSLAGELDFSTANLLAGAASGLPGPLTLDVSELSFIDSSGLRELTTLLRSRGSLTLVGARPYLVRILEVTGLAAVAGMVVQPG